VNLESVEKIAEAVLYEGYMLYPYRPSAVKNQQRWNFGVLCPRSYCEQQNGSEAWITQTECLLEGDHATELNIEARFLQIANRTVGRLTHPVEELPESGEPEFDLVDDLLVGDRKFVPWQEAIERKVAIPGLFPAAFSLHRHSYFEFQSMRDIEPLRNRNGLIEGVLIRESETVSGSVEIDLKNCGDRLIKVTSRLRNLTPYETTRSESRGDALMHSFISTHTILGAEGGAFVSLLEPPENLRELAAQCANLGTWPVLVGDEGARDRMLSSPIILYDFPRVAPESPGSLFDGTEIDEILSLRILTMTDEEKREMRQSDDRAREILERTENMPPEQFMKLHGAMRGLRPSIKEAQ
jgi:hypothetical protein